MPIANNKTDGTVTATDHAAHHNALADAANAAVLKPTTDLVQYVTTVGNDSNSGLSWGEAKLTWAAAIAAFDQVTVNEDAETSRYVGVLYVGPGVYDIGSGVAVDAKYIDIQCEPGVTLRATAAITMLTFNELHRVPLLGVHGVTLDMNYLATVGLLVKNCWKTRHNLRIIRAGAGTGVKVSIDSVTGCYYNEVIAQIRGGVQATATTTSGSPNLTLVTPTTGWVNGMQVRGTGIPAGTTIVSGAGTATMVMSANATASAAGVAITGSGTPSGIGALVEGQSGSNAANNNIISVHATDMATGIKIGDFCDQNLIRDSDVTFCTIGYDMTSGYTLLTAVHEEGTISAEGIVVRTGAVAQAEALYYEKTDVEGTGTLIMRFRGNTYTTFGGTSSSNIDTNFSNTGNWGMVERHEVSTGARVYILDGVEVMRLNRNGTWTFPNAVAAGSVANNTLFRNPTGGLLSYKDNTGGIFSFESRGLKLPVRAAALTNVTISSPGATIEGVSMVAGDRVLLTAQTTASQNGIYVWNGAAVPMTRATDADTAAKLTDSLLATVDEGTDARDSIFSLSTNKPITLDTTSLAFKRVDMLTSPWTTLMHGHVNLAAAVAAVYPAHLDVTTNLLSTAASPALYAAVMNRIDPADYVIGGRAMVMRIIASFAQNAVANAGTTVMTASLRAVTPAGATTTWLPTFGAVVGNTAAQTGGAASSNTRVVSTEFAAPAAALYALVVAVTVATTAGSTKIGLLLQYRYV